MSHSDTISVTNRGKSLQVRMTKNAQLKIQGSRNPTHTISILNISILRWETVTLKSSIETC